MAEYRKVVDDALKVMTPFAEEVVDLRKKAEMWDWSRVVFPNAELAQAFWRIYDDRLFLSWYCDTRVLYVWNGEKTGNPVIVQGLRDKGYRPG